ncbi:MAG: 3'-5' exonuclease [Polyangiaceae bacterium]|nr:3'-5' exonuclease [Polyangiaceae bacterium]
MEAPTGGPWDVPFDEAPLAFVDLEMTGLDPAKDRVIEVCVQRVVGGKLVGSLSTLVSPGPLAVVGNLHVHGIDAEALASAPSFAEVLPQVRALFEGAVPIAHGARWDIGFLRAESERAGSPLLLPHYLDTLVLSRRAFALPSHAMDALCTHFGIARARAHRAEDDVLALREVFQRMVAQLAPKTARDLWDVRIAERHARDTVLAACSAALAGGHRLRVAYRPSRKGAQEMTFVVTSILTDPPRIIGYEWPSRSRRELRAERILRADPEGAEPSK